MSVYLFTYHAYRSWKADNPRGFVQPGKRIQPPNPALARAYDDDSKQPPVLFDEPHQRVLLWIAYDVCRRRNWRLHGVAAEPTHVHFLVSWRDGLEWNEVSKRLKNLGSTMLGRKLGPPGRRWFSRGGSRKRVQDQSHFEYLTTCYLPKHGGLCWREGDPPPAEPVAFKPSASADG